jgi:hypothetical protein
VGKEGDAMRSRLTRYAIVLLHLGFRSLVLWLVWQVDTTGKRPLVPGLAKPTLVNVITVILVICLMSVRDIAWRLRAEEAADVKWTFARFVRGEILAVIILAVTFVISLAH